MKKISLLLALIAFTGSASFATAHTKRPKAKMKISKKVLSRQCCIRSCVTESGGVISITACAGWFLSNDDNAMERACEKAEAALSTQ